MDLNYSGLASWLSTNAGYVTGVLGSATSAYFTQLKTWREKVFVFVAGLGAVYAATDFVNEKLHIGEKLSGYLIGFFALNICAALLKAVRRFGDDADFWTLLKESVSRALDRFDTGAKTTDTVGDKE